MKPSNVDELLEFAIQEEEQAAESYTQLAEKVKEQHVRETLLEMAAQERGHKRRLEEVRAKGLGRSGFRRVEDLRISDYLVSPEPSSELTFQGALILAMKKEKAAFRMYSDLAACADSDDLRELFRFLAQEEAVHKLGFETQYDELILQEN